MKRYMRLSTTYAILALINGVFYREFTKYNNFTSKTSLAVVHTHYFILGMVFFLLLLLLEKNFTFTDSKIKKILITYQFGLNLTMIMLIIRGITQVLNANLSNVINAMISGIAGIGHIFLGISLILILFKISKKVALV